MLSPQHRNLKIGGYHMQFYNIIATINNKLPQDREQADYKSLAESLCEKSETDYQANNKNYYFFTTNIEDYKICFYAIFKINADVTSVFMKFISATELKIKDISVEETTFKRAKITLALAGARKLVNNCNDVLKDFGLDDLYSDYNEELLNGNLTKDSLINKSKVMLFEETILPEIERIYIESPVSRVKGHPVHYLVCCDDQSDQKKFAVFCWKPYMQMKEFRASVFAVLILIYTIEYRILLMTHFTKAVKTAH